MSRITAALIITVLLYSPIAQADPHGGWHGGGGGWGWHGGGSWNPWHHDDDAGANVLGGIIGGALGSYLWGQVQQPPMPTPIAIPVPELQPFTPPWFDYCAQRYRTFDAHTGYYTGFDLKPHFCQ